MTKTYLRPMALVWGPDARRGMAAGLAGALAGGWAAYTQGLVIERGRPGVLLAYQELKDAVPPELLDRIAAPRAPLCGLDLASPKLMGIVNVTPDSFSDGGEHQAAEAGIRHGLLLAQEGAHILDVGGESTRPGAETVAVADEIVRVETVVASLAAAGHTVSIDSRKAAVMRAAAAAGAAIINDVSALSFDPESLALAAHLQCPVVLMHAQGTPETMQRDPRYEDVALEVYDHLEERIAACAAAGLPRHLLLADPGIGFGKTSLHNLQLLQQLTLFHGLGIPLVIGLSRKGFTGTLAGESKAKDRVYGSVGGALQAVLNGAQILRVHDVKATRQALAVAMAALDPDVNGM